MDQQEQLQKMQLLEQNLQNTFSQRQQFQQQLTEVESALSESKDAKETFKIIGNVLISTDKEKLLKDLEEKKELLDLRVKSFEKQEEKLRKESKELQEEIMKNLEKK